MRYIVEPGDTLYYIASKLGTTAEAILEANPGIQPSFVYPGQIIMVPKISSIPMGFYYRVELGDTIYGIAIKFNADLKKLILVNDIRKPYIIYPGQELFIPDIKNSQPPTTDQVYIVQPGDTLYGIAQKFNVTMEEIIHLNNITKPDIIHPGQKLLIPPKA